MRHYLVISTLIGIFLEGIYVTIFLPFISFDMKPGLAVVVLNLFLLLIINQIKLTFWHVLFVLYTLLFSIVLMQGYEAIYLKNLFAISVLSIYFFSLIAYVGPRFAFDLYTRFAYFYAIFALLYFGSEVYFGFPYFSFIPAPISGIANGGLHGLMAEQSVYSITMMPALYNSLKERNKFKLRVPFIIGISIIITGSAMGFIGILLILCLYKKLPDMLVKFFIVLTFLVVGFFVLGEKKNIPESDYAERVIYYCAQLCDDTDKNPGGLYANPSKPGQWSQEDLNQYGYVGSFFERQFADFFTNRILASYEILRTERLPQVHVTKLSAYALASNFLIMKQVIKNNMFFGGGIGSHHLNYYKFIDDLDGAKEWGISNVYLGASDANSMGIRILSEFGIIGFIFVLFVIYRLFMKTNPSNINIIYGVLICFFLVLIRSGNYVQLDLWFFLFIVYFLSSRDQIEKK